MDETQNTERILNAISKSISSKLGEQAKATFQTEGYEALFVLLVTKLRGGDWLERESAVVTLGELGDGRAFGRLVEVLRTDPDSATRCFAATSVFETGGANALVPLLDAVKDTTNGMAVRSTTIYRLGDLQDARAVPVLVNSLEDESPTIRIAAARALGQMGSIEALPHLIQALKDTLHDGTGGDVHMMLREALQMIGEKALPLLSEAAGKEKGVDQVMFTILRKIILNIENAHPQADPGRARRAMGEPNASGSASLRGLTTTHGR